MQSTMNQTGQSNIVINVDTVDQHVMPSNPLSDKLIKLHCKTASCEDAMNVVKKAYDKDKIDLQEFLRNIRQLANK